MMDRDGLADLGLDLLDRELRRRRIACPGVEQDCRSRAHEALASQVDRALSRSDPAAYLARVVKNAVAWELSARRRPGTLPGVLPLDDSHPAFEPSPPTRALFREAMELADRPLRTPGSQAIHATEWEVLRSIVRDNPGARNRHVALEFNRLTGRHMNLHHVSRARRRLGI